MNVQSEHLIVRDLGLVDYHDTWKNMRDFTESRHDDTTDELWVLQHPPVFTQGLAGKPEHILNPHHIPIIQTDRGGQVTYHGPGQLVLYPLINLKRKKINTREFVRTLEHCVIDVLSEMGISAISKCDAPGVYVNDAKIASIGLRVRKNCSYHGIAFNVAMDLTPFSYINPCGYENMKMTQVSDFIPTATIDTIKKMLIPTFLRKFGYNRELE